MGKVVWTEPALNDIREIVQYISQDSPAYAERIGVHIVEAPRRLTEFPSSGRILPEFHTENIRELIYGSYRIIYMIRADYLADTARRLPPLRFSRWRGA